MQHVALTPRRSRLRRVEHRFLRSRRDSEDVERERLLALVHEARSPRRRRRTGSTGRIGPKISSRITGDVGRDVAQHGRREVARSARRARRRRRRGRPSSRRRRGARSGGRRRCGRSRGSPRVVAVELADRAPRACSTNWSLDRRRDEHVVGRDAGLARVQELAPRDAARGDLEVGVAVDDGRALAAELERDRREVLAPPPPSRRARPPAARVEDVVEALGEQRLRLVGRRPRRPRRLGVEVAGHELRERGRGVRRRARTA